VLLEIGNGRARHGGHSTNLVDDRPPDPVVGEIFKVDAFGGIVGPGCLEQTNHANLDQFGKLHHWRQSDLEVHGHSFDHGKVLHQRLVGVVADLLVEASSVHQWDSVVIVDRISVP
jgi:hypothetical protein